MNISSRGATLAVSVPLASLVISLAACSSSPAGSDAATGTQSPVVGVSQGASATFTGTIYASTPLTQATKPFTVRLPGTCASIAAHGTGDGKFSVPSARLPDPQADITVLNFHGPGTYPPAVLAKDKGDILLLPGKSGTGRYPISATAGKGHVAGKEVLFLSKNGAGQLVYSDAHENGLAADQAAAGLINWSCKS